MPLFVEFVLVRGKFAFFEITYIGLLGLDYLAGLTNPWLAFQKTRLYFFLFRGILFLMYRLNITDTINHPFI
jgi:hypothetical protein